MLETIIGLEALRVMIVWKKKKNAEVKIYQNKK